MFETWPFYRKMVHVKEGLQTWPSHINIHCPVCGRHQNWDGEGEAATRFRCRNCKKATVKYYLESGAGQKPGSIWMMKVGQYPPLHEHIPQELERRFDADDLEYYQKAIRSRNFSFGLGALSYLRRVVENRTDDLLDLIGQALIDAGADPKVLDQVAEVKRSRRFDEKIDFAAGILPANLKPGGQNPFAALHDLASAGIHRLTEDECLERFDLSRTAFEYVFRQLEIEKSAAAEFVQAMNAIGKKRSEQPS